jgi:hypothetical protein
MTIPFQERPTCTIEVGAEATGLSRSEIYRRINDGEIETVKAGRYRLLKVPSLLKSVLDDQQLNESIGNLIRGTA